MATLRIDLQDGFAGERVVVRVNQSQVFDATATSNLMTGVAGTIDVDVPDGRVAIDVHVASSCIAASFTIDISQILNVGLAIRNGAIVYRLSDQPFAYI